MVSHYARCAFVAIEMARTFWMGSVADQTNGAARAPASNGRAVSVDDVMDYFNPESEELEVLVVVHDMTCNCPRTLSRGIPYCALALTAAVFIQD